jgi:hypothetical protein
MLEARKDGAAFGAENEAKFIVSVLSYRLVAPQSRRNGAVLALTPRDGL